MLHFWLQYYWWERNRLRPPAGGGVPDLPAKTSVGVHGRLRWWVDDDWALDFSPGVFLWGGSNDDRYELEFPALSARVMLSYGDWVGISAGLDQVRVEGAGSDVDLYGGAYLGSYPGAAVGLMFALVAILYASNAGITGIH